MRLVLAGNGGICGLEFTDFEKYYGNVEFCTKILILPTTLYTVQYDPYLVIQLLRRRIDDPCRAVADQGDDARQIHDPRIRGVDAEQDFGIHFPNGFSFSFHCPLPPDAAFRCGLVSEAQPPCHSALRVRKDRFLELPGRLNGWNF